MSVEDLRKRYNGCKPCLHGSDSRDQTTVGKPTNDRYSWIKGGLEFYSLRQACINPKERAFVGSEPPQPALPSQVISHLSITNTSWIVIISGGYKFLVLSAVRQCQNDGCFAFVYIKPKLKRCTSMVSPGRRSPFSPAPITVSISASSESMLSCALCISLALHVVTSMFSHYSVTYLRTDP